ncbi:MAG: transposase [Isosphaeraceae bacterium]|nr:transposase [Isosphaeraceae bacterium]
MTGPGHTTSLPQRPDPCPGGPGRTPHPGPPPGSRPAQYQRRQIVNALLDVARTGCQGRALPHDFPPWEAAYGSFRL